MRKLGCLVIHGMGAQTPDFADGLRAALDRRLGGLAPRLAWQPVYWADVLEPRESDLLARMGQAAAPDGAPIPLDWPRTRWFIIHNFGDAVAYHRDETGSAYAQVHARISARIADLRTALDDPTAPVVVLAHSLGGHMMSNYVWDRQHWHGPDADPLEPLPTLTALVTFGCNIPLFALSFEAATPIDVPGAGLTDPSLVNASRWLNFLDRDDVLGWPLRPMYEKGAARFTPAQQATLARIEDYAIDVGGPLTSWNPLSHEAYWTDGSFVGPVARYLAGLLQLLPG